MNLEFLYEKNKIFILNKELLEAIKQPDNVENIKILLESGADVNIRDNEDDYTPLMIASRDGNKEYVQILINFGANVNAQTKGFRTEPLRSPLFLAIHNGHTEIIDLLIKNKADVNILCYNPPPLELYTREYSYSLLTHAMCVNKIIVSYETAITNFKILLENGADPNKVYPGNFPSALMFAVDRISLQCFMPSEIKILSPECESRRKKDRAFYFQCVKLLLENNADVYQKHNFIKGFYDPMDPYEWLKKFGPCTLSSKHIDRSFKEMRDFHKDNYDLLCLLKSYRNKEKPKKNKRCLIM